MSGPMQQRILCATDLTARGDFAVQRAGMLADETEAELQLLHVVVPETSERALEQTLQHATDQLRSRARPPLWTARCTPGVAIRTGNPMRIVPDTVAGSPPRLLVLGRHRPRGVRDVLEGTLAARVLATRACPVLLVQKEPRGAYRRVLVALDAAPASIGALCAAESLFRQGAARLLAVHASEPPYQSFVAGAASGDTTLLGYTDGWRRESLRRMRALLRRHVEDAGRYTVRIEQRPPVPGILHAVQEFRPDLLVMGTRGGGRVHRALLGSVANRVLHEVRCDTLVVPQGSVVAQARAQIARRALMGVRQVGEARP